MEAILRDYSTQTPTSGVITLLRTVAKVSHYWEFKPAHTGDDTLARPREKVYYVGEEVKLLAKALTDNKKQRILGEDIFTQIFDVGYVNTLEMAKNSNWNYHYVRWYVYKLGDRGILEHKRKGITGPHYWTLSPDFIYMIEKLQRRIKEGRRWGYW